MAVPVYQNSGAEVANASTDDLLVPFPSSIGAEDFLLLTYGSNGSATPAPTLPSGWTPLADVTRSGVRNWAAWKSASGSESGTQTLVVGNSLAKISQMHRYTGADSVEAFASVNDVTKTILHPDIVTTSADRLAITVTVINDDETATSFASESGGDLVLKTDVFTTLLSDAALSMQTADMASSGTLADGNWTYGGATEDWITFGFAIFSGGDLTQKSLSVTFTTAMATTSIPITAQAISVAFVTAFTNARTTKVAKAIAFVTTMARTQVVSVFRTLSVAFGTVFALVKKTKLAKVIALVTSMSQSSAPVFGLLINVTFDYATALAMVVKSAFAFALGTVFTLVKKVSVLKAVSFVTGFSTAALLQVFRTFNVSFGTSMVLSTAKTIFKTISVAFVTSISLATSFIADGAPSVVGHIWRVLKRRRSD